MSDLRKALFELIREKSYREGDFTLSSGLKSRYYIDLKPTLLDPRGAKAVGALAVEWIKSVSSEVVFAGVAGLTLGADPMVMAISLVAWEQGQMLPASMIRKEPKKHGTSRFIEGIENFKPGANLLVVEDVVTTGGSALKAVDILRDEGFEVTHVWSLVDRESGGAEKFKERGLKFASEFKISDFSN